MTTLRNIALGVLRARHAAPNIAAATRRLGRPLDTLLAIIDNAQVTPVTAVSTLN
ncbi:hypothetical protein BN12_4060019 [Nostocoides japonicum T1-X7]|uniref:Uncharacterized protein n=1 Tax=Nostocoides japonicum T1-X7 TaxID=1194083 RepID=A0A077M513_9MICO|nr:hypothetical protein [Tetrasphaera japonica]CCH79209.1 hypothetical protein BN12_4060019 [Tetrasphaera japonica T1-X7]